MTGTGRGLAVTSPKLIYSEDGKVAYAYSGQITYGNAETTILEFQTGPYPIRANVQVNTLDYDGDDLGIRLYLNDIAISLQRFITVGAGSFTDFPRWEVIIPPLTTFKLTFANLTDAGEHTASGILTGKVIQ